MPNPEYPSWVLRRVAIFTTLGLCWGVVIYVVGWGSDTELHRTALTGALWSSVAIVFAYAGFATFEDVRLAAILRGVK